MTPNDTPIPSSPAPAEASDPVAGRCAVATGSAFEGYVPEQWTVLKDDVYGAIDALNDAVEYARECLDDHETRLGRGTLKNRLWAERIERDIAKFGQLRERLRKCGPLTMPFSPNHRIDHTDK